MCTLNERLRRQRALHDRRESDEKSRDRSLKEPDWFWKKRSDDA